MRQSGSDPADQRRADGKAMVARAREISARGMNLFDLGEPESMPGFRMYQVGGPGGMTVVMPALKDDPRPEEITQAYLDRIEANATGRCPRCDAVASEEASTVHGTAVVHAGVFHETTCPTLVLERYEGLWFDPRAVARLHHEEGGRDGQA